MALPSTEKAHRNAEGLDTRNDGEILSCLLRGQLDALASLQSALPDLAAASELMARTIRSGGRLVYAAAGSSGILALADAAELGGTFGISHQRVAILMAGGLPVDARMPGGTEDDVAQAERDAADISPGDTVIAASASGGTAYPLTIARIAAKRGASVICIANNAGAPLFRHASVAVCIPTPPEVIAGSTRLGAGTAQKAALNLMSTLMGVRLGHVHDGMMVNVVADNDKLRARATRMVARIAGVSEAEARVSLEACGGAVKTAVLVAAGAAPEMADHILEETEGHLRAALARL